MKQNVLLFVMLSCVTTSIYSAFVAIKNQTTQRVFVRINNEKRANVFHHSMSEPIRRLTTFGTAGLGMPIAQAIVKVRQALGFPDFILIEPGKWIILITTLYKGGLARGMATGTIDPTTRRMEKFRYIGELGAPIKKITFARKKGQKTITGTVDELQKQVRSLAKKYGNVDLSDSILDQIVIYTDGFSDEKKSWPYKIDDRNKKYSIKIPEIEEFTYNLDAYSIGREQEGTVVLKDWGKAVRVR